MREGVTPFRPQWRQQDLASTTSRAYKTLDVQGEHSTLMSACADALSACRPISNHQGIGPPHACCAVRT